MADFDTHDLSDKSSPPQSSRRTLDFNGRRYSTLFNLAQALCQNPQAAIACFESRSIQHLADSADAVDPRDPLSRILRTCATKEVSAWRTLVEIQLLVFRRPAVLVDKIRVTTASWENTLLEASAGEDQDAQNWVWNAVEDDVLTPVLGWLAETDPRFRSWTRLPAAESASKKEIAALRAKPGLGVEMPSDSWVRAALLSAMTSADAERKALAECQKMLRWYCEHVEKPCPVFEAECKSALSDGLTIERATVLNLVCRTSHGSQRAFELKEQSLARTLQRASAARTQAEQDKWNAESLSYACSLTMSWLRWQGGFAGTATLFVWMTNKTPNAVVFQLILSPLLCAAAIYGLAWYLVRRAPRKLNELHDEFIPLVASLYLVGILIGFGWFVFNLGSGYPWWLPAVMGIIIPLRLIWRGLGKAPVVNVKLAENSEEG